ncbi:MAG: O-methyltransferase [Clostridiaceae bacterium]|nr:O-methyltransferase [Clostridiaceae bacterium]
MANINHDYIDSFLLGMIPDRSGILKEMEEYAKENHVPIITPDIAGLLAVLIKTAGVKSILEIGTAIGYSAIHMGICAGEGFSITTIERNEELAAMAAGFIKKAGMEDNIRIMTGAAEEILKDVPGSFDMIFVDAAKGQYMDFMKDSIGRLRIGGLFVCDNVLFRGMVAERSLLIRRKITIVKRLKKFLSFISSCDSLQTAVIPMGDGISVCCKLKEVEFNE